MGAKIIIPGKILNSNFLKGLVHSALVPEVLSHSMPGVAPYPLVPLVTHLSKQLLFAISMCVFLLICTCASFHAGSYSLSTMLGASKRGGEQGDNISRLQALVNTQDSNS